MKIYRANEYKLLSAEEKSLLGKITLQNKLTRRKEIDGIKYMMAINPMTGEDVLIEEKLEMKIQEAVYVVLNEELKANNIETVKQLFVILFNRFPDKEKMQNVLATANKSVVKELCMSLYNEMQTHGIEIQNYINLQGLYKELLEEITQLLKTEENNEKAKEKAVVANAIKKTLDEEIEKSGGVEVWINNKLQNKKKINDTYTKNKLIGEVLNKDNSREKKEQYARLLIKAGISANDILSLINIGNITPYNLEEMYCFDELRKTIIDSIGRLNLDNIIMCFIVMRNGEILKNVSGKKVTVSELKRIADAYDEVSAAHIAEFLVEMYKINNIRFTEQEIDLILDSKKSDKVNMIRAYFELAKAGMCNDNKIIGIFDEQVEEENTEDPYETEEDSRVSLDELLEYFNTDKIIDKMRTFHENQTQDEEEIGLEAEKFGAFYFALLEASKVIGEEQSEKAKEELQTKLRLSIDKGNDTDLLIAIELFAYGVLKVENMKTILDRDNEERIIDIYEEELNDNIVIALYKLGIVSRDLLEIIYQEMSSDELEEKMQIQEINFDNTVLLYFLGIINEKQLGNNRMENIDWEKVLERCDDIDISGMVEVLYKNGNIGFEDIKQLKELGKIGAKKAEAILNQLDLEGILIRGLTSEEGQGEKGRKKRNSGVLKREGIDLKDRDELFKELGFEPLSNVYGQTLVVARGSFAGYRVYRDTSRNFNVIIFENETDGSSFIMHEAKAGEFINIESKEAELIGSRSQWREKARTDGSVTAKLHSMHWGKNIINAIVDTSSTFKFDDEQERREYVKTETQRLCEENKDMIEYLRMLKQEKLEK